MLHVTQNTMHTTLVKLGGGINVPLFPENRGVRGIMFPCSLKIRRVNVTLFPENRGCVVCVGFFDPPVA